MLTLRREAGLGMVELLIGVVILGFMVAMAVPSMTTWVRNARVRTVADAVQSGVRLAQAEAQRRGHTVMLFRTSSSDCLTNAVANVDGPFWQVRALPGTLINDQPSEAVQCGVLTDVQTGVNITSSTTALCFGGDGRQATLVNPDGIGVNCTAAAATFDIAPSTANRESRPLRVTVSLAGAVRLCDPSKASTAPDGCR
jgi:type IV fimbrial biogenesis protein FimT